MKGCKWNTHNPEPYGKHGTITDDRLGRHLCRMVGGAPETEANARLIAAAPDLLDALKEASNHLTWGDVDTEVAQKVNAAIAKAEGATP